MNNRNIIKVSHELNHFKGGYTKTELDFIYAFISTIKNEDTDLKEYVMDLSDLEKKLEKRLELPKINYIFDSLITKSFKINNEKELTVYSFFQKFSYDKKKKTISVKFNSDLKRHLLQLKTYALGNFKDILLFKSEYSKRLYMLLAQWKKTGEVEYTVDELREMLEIPDSYKYGNFKQKVLKVAEKEMSKKSSLFFTYKEVKTGRSVSSIIFKVKVNDLDFENFKEEIKTTYPDHQLLAINQEILYSDKQGELYYIHEDGRRYLDNDYAAKCWAELFKRKEKLAIYTPHLFQEVY